MTAAGFSAGWRSGAQRALATNVIAIAVLAWGLSSLVAAAEKRAVLHGAAIIRTHDVAATRDAVRVAERFRRP